MNKKTRALCVLNRAKNALSLQTLLDKRQKQGRNDRKKGWRGNGREARCAAERHCCSKLQGQLV
jgi:hypothetical protein